MQIMDHNIDWELLKNTFNLNTPELKLLSDINDITLAIELQEKRKPINTSWINIFL